MTMRETAAGSGVNDNGAMVRVATAQGRLDSERDPREFRAQSRLQAATKPSVACGNHH